MSQPETPKNSLNPYFWGSRSFRVISVGSGTTGKLVNRACALISSKSVYVCNRSHARRANTGK